jgi:hypothetical protein
VPFGGFVSNEAEVTVKPATAELAIAVARAVAFAPVFTVALAGEAVAARRPARRASVRDADVTLERRR